jgi:hypothetical protein
MGMSIADVLGMCKGFGGEFVVFWDRLKKRNMMGVGGEID